MTCRRISAICVAMIVVAVIGCKRVDSPPEAAQQDSDVTLPEIDPAQIQYEQTLEIPTGLGDVHAMAVGLGDDIHVAGDKLIRRFAADGTREADIALDGEAKCLAIGGADHVVPGRIYAGIDNRVEVFDAKGAKVASWKSLGEKALLTSLATSDADVFVADAGNRIVLRFDTAGVLKGRIGATDAARKIPGFIITSGYFDVAVGPDDLLYAVNPRRLRIEGYTFQGDLERFWGHGSPEIDGFFGCCNPAHFTVMPDGRFVTAEKGFPRIKIYSKEGRFECVVAGPKQIGAVAHDVAADSRGRILVLDPASASVRVFQRKKAGQP